jgi:hypothetical protein
VPELDQLLAHIRRIWPDPTLLLPRSDDRYRSLPLCGIDAVYSIGVRYESTERTVADFCKWSRWNCDQEYTVNEFIDLLDTFDGDWEMLATEVFRNRQRTSSRSGILKAEAVYRFARGLLRCGINTLTDLSRIERHECIVSAITAIPGQSSGISLKYFLMLAGYDGIVKPDRMVARFVADALGRMAVAPDFAEKLVLSAHEVLRSETPRLTAALLDYGIWSHQRNGRRKRAPKPSCL